MLKSFTPCYQFVLAIPKKFRFAMLIVTGYLVSAIVIVPAELLTVGELVSPLSEKKLSVSLFIIVCVVAPLSETYLFQHLIYKKLFSKLSLKNKEYLKLSLSSLLFGLAHHYSLVYVIWATAQGVYLYICYDYFIYTGRNAFWGTCIIHAIRNTIACLAFVL